MLTPITTEYLYRKGEMPPMLVRGLVPRRGLLLLSAEPGVGKTFFTMELARAVTTGTAFMGEFPTEAGSVLFVGEDAPTWDYASQWRKVVSARTDYNIGWLVNQGANLDTDAAAGALVNAANGLIWDEDSTQAWAGVDLIIFDTLRAVHHGDENDNGWMQNIMERLRKISAQTNAAIVVTHHLNKPTRDGVAYGNNRVRGASAIIGAVDGHIQLTRSKGLIKCDIPKSRAIAMDPFSYDLSVSPDECTMSIVADNDPAAEIVEGTLKASPEGTPLKSLVAAFMATRIGMTELTARNRVNAILYRLQLKGDVRKIKHGVYLWKGPSTT